MSLADSGHPSVIIHRGLLEESAVEQLYSYIARLRHHHWLVEHISPAKRSWRRILEFLVALCQRICRILGESERQLPLTKFPGQRIN